MFGFKATEYDKKVYEEELRDFLPDSIIDAHVHIWTPECREGYRTSEKLVSWPDLVAADCTYEDLMSSYETMFPGKRVRAALMTHPDSLIDRGNAYALECMKAHGLPGLYCIRPETSKREILEAFAKGFTGLKPYLNYAPPYIPAKEIRIYDFITPEQFGLMNELKGIIMLHISRDGRLNDPLNIAQLMEIDEKYPDAKVIVAHIGRAYTPESLGKAFDTLRHSRHLLFDFTATTYEPAMSACIEAVGVKRLMLMSAARSVIVADHSKFGRVALARICDLKDQLPFHLRYGFKKRGILCFSFRVGAASLC